MFIVLTDWFSNKEKLFNLDLVRSICPRTCNGVPCSRLIYDGDVAYDDVREGLDEIERVMSENKLVVKARPTE